MVLYYTNPFDTMYIKFFRYLNLLLDICEIKFGVFTRNIMKNILIFTFTVLIMVSCASRQQIVQETKSDTYAKLKARDHYTSGMFYQLENNYEKALIEYFEALLYDSSSYSIYNRIAENHMALGRYESALRYLQKSLSLNPSNVETYRFISDCHYRLKNDEEAVKYLNEVLKFDPLDENTRSLLLLLYRKTSNHIGLAEQYKQMINIYGEDENWVRKAATIYLQNDKIDDALVLFKSYVESDSLNAGMWYSLGTVYEMKNMDLSALSAYKKALKLSPDFDQPAQRIRFIYRQKNEWDKLIQLFEPILAKHPQLTNIMVSLAEAYMFKEDYKKSRELLLPALNHKDINWQVYEILGRVELNEKNYALAGEYFKKILEIDKKNRIGWIFLGFVYSDMDSLDLAEKNYRNALEYLPDDPFLLTFHGSTLGRLGRDNEALVQLERSIEIDPENINALLTYGLTLNRLGKDEQAIEPFKRVLKNDAMNLTALTTLAMIYDNLKMHTQSDSLYEDALVKYPDNDLLMNNYSYSLSERGLRLEYALMMAKKAIQAQPDNGAYLDTIGWIYYKMGQFQLALEHINKSLEKRENSAVVVEHLGDVYLELGEIDKAKEMWKQSLEMDAENKLLRQKLENH